MSIVVDGWTVMARRAAAEARLPGGVSGWFEIAPNRMACSDRDLCAVGFMVREDAVGFLTKVEAMGLVGARDDGYRDVAVIDPTGPWKQSCAWLRFGRYAGVQAAWLAGSDPDPLVVPLVWSPGAIFHLSAEDAAQRLRFVRRDGSVEVYLDTVTGKEVYRGRTSPPDIEGEEAARFQAIAKRIMPLLPFNGVNRELGFFERRRLAAGIRELEALASDDSWRVLWFLGMARRAARDPEAAFAALERAYHVNPSHADLSREFGAQCLALGRGAEAVLVCEKNCRLHPEDAGLRANLALACTIAGDMKRAKQEVTRALTMAPDDAISRALANLIDEVIAGNRRRPTSYP